jgi:hypothetical protein
MMPPCLEQALKYRNDNKFSVFPVGQDKKPLVEWKKYQGYMAEDDHIIRWWQKWPRANVGIATGKLSDLGVVDIDSEEGRKNIMEVLGPNWAAPLVRTPRGGIHIYFKNDNRVKNKVGVIPGTDFRGEGGYVVAPPSLGQNGKPYEWFQGFGLGDIPIPPLPQAYIDRVTAEQAAKQSSHEIDENQAFEQGRRNSDLFHALYAMSTWVPEQELRILAYQLGRSTKPPLEDKEIEAICTSVLTRAKKKELNLAQEVQDFVLCQDGVFSIMEINREFGFLDGFHRADRKNVAVIIDRMEKKKLIEKFGEKAGVYRLIDTTEEEIDWRAAQDKAVPLRLPLGIDEWVYFMPRSLICVAGFQDAGKTTFALEAIKLNMNEITTKYLCSDLGPEEIKARLSKHTDITLDEWNFKAVERSSNFADVIDPDGFNVIDYVEIGDAFWKIQSQMAAIWRQLNKGVALICIQKKFGEALGRGKEFSLEKPRLYLSMDPGKVRIIKAKFWKRGLNPVGYTLNYDIVDGARFVSSGEWYYQPVSQEDFVKPWQRKLFT